MKKLTIRIPMEPTPKGRPKFRIVKIKAKGKEAVGRAFAYTPKKTADFEQRIAEYYMQSTNGFKFEREQALAVNLVFGMPIPKSTPKSKRESMINGIIQHTKKPDIDNLTKAVLDGLNKVAWEDDSQIVRISAMKEYSTEPYIYIYIHEWID